MNFTDAIYLLCLSLPHFFGTTFVFQFAIFLVQMLLLAVGKLGLDLLRFFEVFG